MAAGLQRAGLGATGLEAAGSGSASVEPVELKPDSLERAGVGYSEEIPQELALRLCELTSNFYQQNAASFSQTRQAPWEGWQRVYKLWEQSLCYAKAHSHLGKQSSLLSAAQGGKQTAALVGGGCQQGSSQQDASSNSIANNYASLNILDIACGNLRFERYLADELLGRRLSCVVVDDSKELVLSALANTELSPNPAFCEINFQSFDICDALAAGNLSRKLAAPDNFASLAVSFGFLHHIPRFDWRVRLLRAMAAKVKPGGVVAVSAWCFMDDARLAAKAQQITPAACERLGVSALPKNDYFLGWQNRTDTLRYCHHFTAEELDALTAAVAPQLTPLARFQADGKSGALNAYLVFRKNQ